MNDLRHELASLAEQARPTGDAQSAIRVARRRRRSRQAVTIAAAVVAVVGAATVVVARPGPTGTPAATATPAPVVALRPDAPELPTDDPVGPAAMIVGARDSRWNFTVVLPDGRQFGLVQPPSPSPGGLLPRLSPDGRWLVWNVPDGVDPAAGVHAELRDLTGTGTRTLAGLAVDGWSANGAWAAAGGDAGTTILRTSDWRPAGTLPASIDILSVLDDGSVLAYRPGAAQSRSNLALAVLGPSGAVLRTLDIDVSSVIAPHEFVDRADGMPGHTHGVRAALGGEFGVLQLSFDGDGETWLASGAFIVFDAMTGAVTGRLDLPGFDPRSPAWGLSGLSDGRIVLSQHIGESVAVVLMDPVSAALVPTITITADRPLWLVAASP